MDGRVPVVAAEERRRQRARRQHVLVAAQDVRDLAGILLVHAVQGEAGEPLRRLGIERGRTVGHRERQGGGGEQGEHAAS